MDRIGIALAILTELKFSRMVVRRRFQFSEGSFLDGLDSVYMDHS